MDILRQVLRDLPRPVRWAVFGAIALGVPGGVAGLIIGLRTYAPTAWAATAELSLPAAFVGAVLGAGLGSVLAFQHHLRGK